MTEANVRRWLALSYDLHPAFSQKAAQFRGIPGIPNAYTVNYLIDLKCAVILDVEPTTAVRNAEVTAARTMITRTARRGARGQPQPCLSGSHSPRCGHASYIPVQRGVGAAQIRRHPRYVRFVLNHKVHSSID